MEGAGAAVILAVASLSCLLLSPPAVSAAAGAAEVAGGAAHRNIERIEGDPLSCSVWSLVLKASSCFGEEFLVICFIDCLRIVISGSTNSGLSIGNLES